MIKKETSEIINKDYIKHLMNLRNHYYNINKNDIANKIQKQINKELKNKN
jgi:hypothetical protein